MNLSENLPTDLDPKTSFIHQNESMAKRRSARGVLRLALTVVIAGVVLCIPITSPVLAKSELQADAKGTSAIDP